MKIKFILLSLLALLVFSACNNEERKKAEAARIEAEIQAEAERIAALMLAETERMEAEAEAEAERIAAEEEAEAERIAAEEARIAAEEAKAREKAMLAKYEELMVNHSYSHDGLFGDFVFALPNANGEGVGVRRQFNCRFHLFLYKIKDNGSFIIDFGKKTGVFYDWEYVQRTYENNDAIAENNDVVKEGKYYVSKYQEEFSKAEVYFYYDREMEYYDLSNSKTYSCYKRYDEDLYQEAMKCIKHCLPKAKEIMKR